MCSELGNDVLQLYMHNKLNVQLPLLKTQEDMKADIEQSVKVNRYYNISKILRPIKSSLMISLCLPSVCGSVGSADSCSMGSLWNYILCK